MPDKTIPIHEKKYIMDWLDEMSNKTGETISSIYRRMIRDFYESFKDVIKEEKDLDKVQGTISINKEFTSKLEKVSDLFYNKTEAMRFLSFWSYLQSEKSPTDKEVEKISRILFDMSRYFLKKNGIMEKDAIDVIGNVNALKIFMNSKYDDLPSNQKDFFDEFSKRVISSW